MNVGMRRAVRAASAALLVGLTATSCASAARSPAGGTAPARPVAAHTDVRTFAPYDADGTLTVPVRGHRSGRCWSESVAAPGARAYRCFAGNTILDPCFAPPHAARPGPLACVADPWSAAVALRLTAKLPARTPDRAAGRPWALVLATGARCVASTGTVPSVAGVNLPYQCDDGTAAALTGAPGPLRHAYDAAPHAHALPEVAVRVVWRA